MYKPMIPVITPEFEDIDVAIRKERTRLQDIEFDTDTKPNDHRLRFLQDARKRGVNKLIMNL